MILEGHVHIDLVVQEERFWLWLRLDDQAFNVGLRNIVWAALFDPQLSIKDPIQPVREAHEPALARCIIRRTISRLS